MFGSPRHAEQTDLALIRGKLRSQSHQRRLRALKWHVINIRVCQPASALRIIMGKSREAIGSKQGATQVVPTRETAFASVQAYHAAARHPASGPVNDGRRGRGNGL